jgi:hypothetical protein
MLMTIYSLFDALVTSEIGCYIESGASEWFISSKVAIPGHPDNFYGSRYNYNGIEKNEIPNFPETMALEFIERIADWSDFL